MPHTKGPRAPARQLTPFAELDAVLAELVSRVRAVLADNFVGAYLHGSFAVGDCDEHSDVDFIVVVRRDLSPGEVAALDAAHDAVYALPSPWAQHLEGSYAPAAILRRWSTTPRDPPQEPRDAAWADPGTSGMGPRVYPFWYLNNGARRLVRSEHDNTRVVRWILRRHGVTLAGPPPKTLVDRVAPEALKGEARALLETVAGLAQTDVGLLDTAWVQAFMAVLCARLLQTLATGEVRSKKSAVAFARARLEPRWAGLVERAFAFRLSQPRGPDAPQRFAALRADPADKAETAAFLRDALGRAGPAAEARAAPGRVLAVRTTPSPQAPGRPPPARGRTRGGWTPPPIRPGGRGRRG